MKILIATIASLLAVPALAQKTPAPAPAPKMECCCKKMGMMGKMSDKAKPVPDGAADPHAGHDMTKR